jgi:hypothetical protein
MSKPDGSALDQHAAVRDYMLVGLGALTVMVVALALRRADPWVVFPAFLGALALRFRWRSGPVIVLLAVMMLLGSWWLRTTLAWLLASAGLWLWRLLHGYLVRPRLHRTELAPPQGVLPVSDLLLAASVLTYAVAQYRLQGLVVRLFPPDPRQARAAAQRGKAEAREFRESLCRPPGSVTTRELVLLPMALAACAGLAYLAWSWLRGQTTDLPIVDSAWRGILALWLLGGGVLVAAGLLRYLALRRMTREEAALYLQDVLWRETRREQRRLNRWLAWAWLGRRRREEKEPS